MKKNLLYALALATSMVACTDDYTDWGTPQQNDPEAIKSASLTVTAAETIDFATLTDDDEYVTIFTSPAATADEGAKVEGYTVTLDNKYTLPVTINQNKGQVVTADLENALINLYGRRPTERTMSGLVKAYVKNTDGMTVTPTTTVAIKATPLAPVIEDAYYLVGAPNNWSWKNSDFKFNHSDKDVYDDPIFTLIFASPTDENGNRVDCWFKINPKSAFENGTETSGTLGCATDGSTDLEGTLVPKGETTCGAMNLPASDGAKFYKLTLNMLDYTYKVEILNFEEFIYVPGNHQNWTPETAPRLHGPGFDGIYTGFSCLNGGFKFTKGPGWGYGEYNWGSFTSHPEGFTGEGGGDITCTTKGFYFIKANVADGTLEATPTTWGIIGDATANGWDSDQDMTWNEEKHCWCATITLTDGTIKFRANDGWDINFGGNPENLNAGGDNIPVTAGTYDIDLYLERTTSENIYCTLTKK